QAYRKSLCGGVHDIDIMIQYGEINQSDDLIPAYDKQTKKVISRFYIVNCINGFKLKQYHFYTHTTENIRTYESKTDSASASAEVITTNQGVSPLAKEFYVCLKRVQLESSILQNERRQNFYLVLQNMRKRAQPLITLLQTF
ncbi:unnamed protein product, partial [Didymodactylos carnosus]